MSPLAALHNRLEFETLISDMSARMLAVSMEDIDAAVTAALEKVRLFFDADRCALLQVSEAVDSVRLTHASYAEGVLPLPTSNEGQEFPWSNQKLMVDHVPVIVARMADLPPEAARDRETFEQLGIRSHVTIPILVGSAVSHLVVMHAVHEEREWSEVLILRLRLLAEMLVNHLERKHVHDSLRTSEARFELAAASAGAGLWELDLASGNIVWATPETRRLYGFGADEAVTRDRGMMVVHPDDREVIERERQRASAEHRDYAAEYRVILPDGATRWLAVRGRIHPDNSGTPARMLAVSVDITERKLAEMAAQRSRNEIAHLSRVAVLGELSGSLAHELNQPLGAILRNAEAAELLLQEPSPDLDEVRAILSDIRHDDQRAGQVIERMRDFIRRGRVEHRPVDLNLVAREVIALVRPDAEIRQVRVALETDPALPPVQGDRVQLQQVVLNLLLNAMDSLCGNPPGNRLVTVQTRRAGASVELSVSDNGHGLPPAERSRVFEPFFTSKPNGLGMGLAISRSIVEAHGGWLSADDNAQGGATFTFTLSTEGEELPDLASNVRDGIPDDGR